MTKTHSKGFSLMEALLAVAITTVLCTIVFQIFHQNQSVFREQTLLLEMQQAARAAASQVASDIRAAGQGVPVHTAAGSGELTEDTAVFLSGSDSSHIRFRAGVSNVESRVTNALPFDMTAGSLTTLFVEQAALFSAATGANPAGRYVYLSGRTELGEAWIRAELVSISAAAKTMNVSPVASNVPAIRFTSPPVLTLEEAVSLFYDGATGSLRRTTATNMSDPANPGWAPANEVAANVAGFIATYYDREGTVVAPDTFKGRARITRVDVRIVLKTAEKLPGGLQPSYGVSVRSTPRNLSMIR